MCILSFFDLELFPLNFRLTAEEKEREAMVLTKPVKVEDRKQPKPAKKPGETLSEPFQFLA